MINKYLFNIKLIDIIFLIEFFRIFSIGHKSIPSHRELFFFRWNYICINRYDDLFSIKYAASRKGIVVSNDQFKDVKAKNIPDYTDQVVNR